MKLPKDQDMLQRSNNPDMSNWKRWFRKHAGKQLNHCEEVCGLRNSKKKVLHIPASANDGRQRVFGCAPPCRGATTHMLRNHVHYTSEIISTAAHAVATMGALSYVAVHLRRNDFQYDKAGSADLHADTLKKELKPGEPVYIATDELEGDYIAEYRAALKGHEVYTSKSFDKFFNKLDWRKLGVIEQVVCSGARHFFGMPLSTYTHHIFTMRKYLSTVDGVQTVVDPVEFAAVTPLFGEHRLPIL